MITDPTLLQSAFVETILRDELQFLAHHDRGARPPGWLLTPRSVVTFLLGSAGETLRLAQADTAEDDEVPDDIPRELCITGKLVAERALVEQCVVTLAGPRALLLMGAPGTGKSLAAELLAAAVSKTSALVVQGATGTTVEQIRYGWHLGAVLSRGPSREALVPSPVVTAMRRGGLVRIEELTRCLPDVQDALLPILAERRLAVPELDGHVEMAQVGFNVIATANALEGAPSSLSPSLRRRFTVAELPPIADAARERALVRRQAEVALARAAYRQTLDDATLDVLVTTFRDLRSGLTAEGWEVQRPTAVTSTAEAIVAATSLGLGASYLSGAADRRDPLAALPELLVALVLREAPQDLRRLLAYWDGPVTRRAAAAHEPWARLLALRGLVARD